MSVFPSGVSGYAMGRIGSLVMVVILVGPAVAAGQGGPECDVPRHGGLVMQTVQSITGEDRIFYFKTPVLRCPGGVRIAADSAVVYESTNYSQFWGDVEFSDETSRLTADQAQYFSEQRRLVATGNTVLTEGEDGSVVRGDQMTLIRAGPQREEDFLTVTGRRPHATLFPSQRAPVDTVAPGSEPDTATASDAVADTSDTVTSPDTVPAGEAVADTAGSGIVPDTVGLPEAPADTTEFQPLPDSVLVVAEDTIPPLEPRDTVPVPEIPEEPEEEGPRIPYEIDARTFTLEGSRYFRATGSVVVTRDSLVARSDSLEYDQEQGSLLLSQDASVTTAQTDLSARTIRMSIPQDEVREAMATGRAVLEGEDLRLLAPLITLFFSQGVVERLVAVRDPVADSVFAEMDEEERAQMEEAQGPLPPAAEFLGLTLFPRRPYALAQDFILEGDSVEVQVPQEVLSEVKAMGRARGESAGRDSLNADSTPSLIRRDWLEGDTIVALFQSPGQTATEEGEQSVEPLETSLQVEAAPEDSARGMPQDSVRRVPRDSTLEDYVLERLVARGGARSMYRMAPSDSTLTEERGQFAIHYVVGDEITIRLNAEGEAESMEVVGQTRGIHLEPTGEVRASADTLTVPDTAAVPPDTASTNPDTAAVFPGAGTMDPAFSSDPPRMPDMAVVPPMRAGHVSKVHEGARPWTQQPPSLWRDERRFRVAGGGGAS